MSRFSFILIILLALNATLYCQSSEGLYGQIRNSRLETSDDTLSYALAVMSYVSWSRDNVYPDPVIFARALIESKSGTPLMSEENARNFIMAYIKDRQAKQAEIDKAQYKDYIEANETFLAKNKQNPSVKVTPSGLQYEVVTMGSGPVPTRESTVKVHYTGRLIDGTEFDSSIKRNAPAQFPVSGVIPGWTEALQLMPVGSKFILYIPQELGYGSRGAGDRIKPYSTLIFEVELLEIVK